MRAPTVISPLKTASAPKPMIATPISFSSMPVTACATAEMVSTLKRVVMVCAVRSSQTRPCNGSMASDLMVRMP
jgi:hypothetical protein